MKNSATIYRAIARSLVGLLLTAAAGTVFAAGGTVTDPAGVAPDRYVYYPGTEALAEDEIRVVACGTRQSTLRSAGNLALSKRH